MQPHILAKRAETSPGKLFWLVVVAVMLGQIVAFWMLCTDQVRKAEGARCCLAGRAHGDDRLPALHPQGHAPQLRVAHRHGCASPAKPVDLALH